ncbi:MAG: ATP-dependent DNA ligase [Deltaproteobacteria bacterium]|nr:ATP-dependent DNA ligase [Deltaproteobacteria bacterium]
MSFFDTTKSRALGKGLQAPAGSVTDPAVSRIAANYKRTVASRYRAISPDEIDYLPEGKMYVSPKIDGHMWLLVFDQGQPFLVNPAGRVIYGDIPVLAEAATFVSRVSPSRAVFAGELFAVRKGGRPRFDGVPDALGGEANATVGKLGWACFDVIEVEGVEGGSQNDPYEKRLELMQRIFEGGKRARAIKTESVSKHDDVRRLYGEWVEGGKGEGLVIRTRDTRTWKLKPVFTLDAAVIGYTERSDAPDQVRSVLLALMREDGQFQLIGSCGNLGNDADRTSLMRTLEPTLCDSNYRFAARSGELYRFVKATVVMEIRVTDLQVENASGRDVNRMVLDEREDGWHAVRPFPGVSLIHPVLSRLRDDKSINATDIRASQVLERVPVSNVGDAAEAVERKASDLQRREVWVKETKGVRAVRKLLLWKTNKDMDDPDFPAYVVTWVDYSPGRQAPIKREVRLAPTRADADSIAETMIAKGVKRGWNAVGA